MQNERKQGKQSVECCCYIACCIFSICLHAWLPRLDPILLVFVCVCFIKVFFCPKKHLGAQKHTWSEHLVNGASRCRSIVLQGIPS